MKSERNTSADRTYLIGGVSRSADTFTVNQTFVLRINISAKNAHS